jgi:hypothetical protein
LAGLVDVTGTVAETYLKSRRIEPPYPDFVRFCANARCGEGAIAGILRSHGRVIGVQLGFLDPDGRKSTVEPIRRRFMLEKVSDAVFEIASPGSGPVETIIAEGIEDALSIHRWGRRDGAARNWRIIGLPGIGALRHVKVDKDSTVTVVRDGDTAGSPADLALADGIDRLLLQTERVFVTATPLGQDANAILCNGGVDGLTALLDGIEPAVRSRNGVLLWLAGLDWIEYEAKRTSEAKKLGVRVRILDEEVAHIRREEAQTAPETAGFTDYAEEIDLEQVLDGILKEIKRYIVAPETLLATTALWCAHTYLVHHKLITLNVSPRFGIQARDAGCGKSLLLEIVGCLVPNPEMVSSISGSALLRCIPVDHPTMLIDEADQLFRSRDPYMLAIMNAGHRRRLAYVRISTPTPDGGWISEKFGVWTAQAMASIGELPRQQQDRSIVVHLHKALAREVPAQLEDGTSAQLETLQSQLALWAAQLDDLEFQPRPKILDDQPGRVHDNWRPLIAIAALAGGRWPALCEQVIAEAIGGEKRLSRIQRLLLSIRRVFDTPLVDFDVPVNGAGKPKATDRLTTGALISLLIGDEEEEWGTANRGREITPYWLRDNLRHLLDPPGAQQWQEPVEVSSDRVHHRGYTRAQFEKAWAAHLADVDTPIYQSSQETSGPSGPSGTAVDNVDEFAVNPVQPSGASGTEARTASRTGSASCLVPDEGSKNLGNPPPVPDGPDVPHGGREDSHALVHRFFEVTGNGQTMWMLQRLDETAEQHRDLKIGDARRDWLTDFDALDDAERGEIREIVKSWAKYPELRQPPPVKGNGLDGADEGAASDDAEKGDGGDFVERTPNESADPAVRRKRMSKLDRDIVAYAKAHAEKKVAGIAKHFGQPPDVIRSLLPDRS